MEVAEGTKKMGNLRGPIESTTSIVATKRSPSPIATIRTAIRIESTRTIGWVVGTVVWISISSSLRRDALPVDNVFDLKDRVGIVALIKCSRGLTFYGADYGNGRTLREAGRVEKLFSNRKESAF